MPRNYLKFDSEGEGYDYDSAKKHGLKADDTGHWPSRVPQTGLLLKGRKHKTWHKTEKAEKELGYKIIKRNGRYYSIKK
jgi:hypothetical protein